MASNISAQQVREQITVAIARAIAELEVRWRASGYENIGQGGSQGHSVDWFDADNGSGLAYDAVVIGGVKVTGVPDRTTNFLQVNRNTTPPEFTWIAAMPVTADPGCEVYDVTKNRIYLPGEVAG